MEQTNYFYGEYSADVFDPELPSNTPKVSEGYGDTVAISKAEYEDLLEDARWLACLEQAGVDNWDGIEFAQEIFDAFNS